MEIFDLVDENDKIIGTATRDECHSNPDLMHHTVQFTLVDLKSQEILLTQRSLNKNNDAGMFTFLGEHMLSGEDYNKGLRRGAKEELSVDVIDSIETANNIFRYDQQSEFVRFFLVIKWDGEINFDKREMENIQWKNLHELREMKNQISDMTNYWIDNVNWDHHLAKN